MDGRMVAEVPWEKDLNSRPIGALDTPVWIDLIAIDPLLEIHANYFLNQVGRLVFDTTSANLSRFANIRGCVLINLDKPILGQVQVDVAGEGEVKIEIQYKSLNFCKYCRERGHPE